MRAARLGAFSSSRCTSILDGKQCWANCASTSPYSFLTYADSMIYVVSLKVAHGGHLTKNAVLNDPQPPLLQPAARREVPPCAHAFYGSPADW